jgi:hypothetical protein
MKLLIVLEVDNNRCWPTMAEHDQLTSLDSIQGFPKVTASLAAGHHTIAFDTQTHP